MKLINLRDTVSSLVRPIASRAGPVADRFIPKFKIKKGVPWGPKVPPKQRRPAGQTGNVDD